MRKSSSCLGVLPRLQSSPGCRKPHPADFAGLITAGQPRSRCFGCLPVERWIPAASGRLPHTLACCRRWLPAASGLPATYASSQSWFPAAACRGCLQHTLWYKFGAGYQPRLAACRTRLITRAGSQPLLPCCGGCLPHALVALTIASLPLSSPASSHGDRAPTLLIAVIRRPQLCTAIVAVLCLVRRVA